MGLTNLRKQYAVGQGCFHTGEVFHDEGPRVRYVADCGAMPSYARQRDRRIDAYVQSVISQSAIDLLFISHAHIDHLNGVERLLHRTSGLSVKTIVLPLLSVKDRLLCYARAISEDESCADDSFYRDFVVNPVSALGRFNPNRIILIVPGNRGKGAPFSRPDCRARDQDLPFRGEEPASWSSVGSGTWRSQGIAPGTSNTGVYVMPDSLGISCAKAGASAWLLAPFVDPSATGGDNEFMRSLARQKGLTSSALQRWLGRPGNLNKILAGGARELKAAYASMTSDQDVTSMCLFSGPVSTDAPPLREYHGKFGKFNVVGASAAGVAWLGTADANLSDGVRRSAFLRHYGSLLNEVGTMTLPHHGSERHFHESLLNRIDPSFCVACADQVGGQRHPGAAVIQSVASTGCFLSVVTASVLSEVEEIAIAMKRAEQDVVSNGSGHSASFAGRLHRERSIPRSK